MDQAALYFRRCQVPGCSYFEPRGSRLGDFINGLFVCPEHADTPEKTRMYLAAFRDQQDPTP